MKIRAAIKEDLPIILDIMNDAILHTTAIYDYHPRTPEFIDNWFLKKGEEGMPVLVCEYEEQAIGFGSYSQFRTREAYKFSVEHSIYIHKDFRGQGMGSQLMEALIESAKSQQFHTLIAGIDAENKGSIHFHEKFRFKEVAHFHEVGFKFNRWLDLIFMQLFL
ncbi:MAG: N-acetyltransferase family protein [Flavisolibacter sp.]|nr:N-acetyltransferase family protein [Flavisolibacter sp.]